MENYGNDVYSNGNLINLRVYLKKCANTKKNAYNAG